MFTHRRSFVAAVLLLLSGCDTAAEPPQPDPAALEIVSGDDQEFVVGAALPNPLVVRVTDLNGNPKQGALVKWTVTGYGSVSPDSSRTDAAGTAQTTWTLPTSAGAATVTATT